MSWKSELQLSDLEPETELEITCRRCRLTRYERQAVIAQRKPELRHARLDEVERALHCAGRHCRGAVRLSLMHDDKTEGFVGGMA